MTIDVTWPKATPMSEEEKTLRRIFDYIGVDQDLAEDATLRTMMERYKRGET